MKWTIRPIVIRVWMPIGFSAWVCLVFGGAPAPENWLLPLPMLLLTTFMTTLAEIHDEGKTIRVKRWWSSMHLAKPEVARIRPSFLDGISVIELRRFVFPWGRIYYVDAWSTVGTLAASRRPWAGSATFGIATGDENGMKSGTPPITIRLLLPIMFSWACLLLGGPSVYWLLALPLLLVTAFMTMLADVHDEGQTIRVKRWWHSIHIAKEDVVNIGPSFLDGISVLELRRFAFPWGRIYFVDEWSTVGTAAAERAKGYGTDGTKPSFRRAVRAIIESITVAVFGFVAGRGTGASIHNFRIEASTARIEAIALAAALCVAFAIARSKKSSSAPLALYVAAWITGLVYW